MLRRRSHTSHRLHARLRLEVYYVFWELSAPNTRCDPAQNIVFLYLSPLAVFDCSVTAPAADRHRAGARVQENESRPDRQRMENRGWPRSGCDLEKLRDKNT